jgi:L-threonylcarbamoyladenylate synthase
VQIREATKQEFDAVVNLTRVAWSARVDVRSSGHSFSRGALQQLVTDGATVLVAAEGTELLGSLLILPPGPPSVADEPTEISKVCVAPHAFGSGVGEALMNAAHRLTGNSETLLAVSLYQPELTRWYARFGYVVDGSRTYRHASPSSPQPITLVRRPHTDGLAVMPDPIGDAADALRDGRLVGMPTETVYGLAADASNVLAVRSVFAAKGRPVDHPLIVHLASRASLDTWAIHSDDAHRLAAAFWPGPLTIVLPRQTHVLDEVTGGRETVALRVPRHPLALALIALLGPHAGVVAPSANPFGAVSPTTADHVRADGLTDLVIDGGPTQIGVESTIIELVDQPQILRPGAIAAAQLAEVLGTPVLERPLGESRAPGMLASHYAPRAGVKVISQVDQLDQHGADVGFLGPSEQEVPPGVVRLPTVTPYTADGVAAVLYARLREADDLGLRLLYVVEPIEGGLRDAVRDRLQRAAHNAPTDPHR